MKVQERNPDLRREEFVRLFLQHERGLYRYILSLVLNVAVADEINQNTSLLLWEEFDRFDLNTDFGAWARTIAYYQVLKHRKANARERMQFDSELLQVLADRATVQCNELVAREDHLLNCLSKLSEFKRRVIRLYYSSGMTAKVVAKQLDKSVAVVEKTIARTRRALHDCIETAMRREDRA
jgi:RNA polymerase sigma-70 factor (ECF subfamily)